ncbi:diguanylate cyclase/phosphodiesterase (GGDEF & EAL domains) with PAS/PAC sensor(s) [hydrothermal vent metagenome]|uniref:Diguanylate cyclase/phosphodiesterase (GGDEF & EAL domains) with PAS/PAC sensor(S) n=1 Tax=hydrothermal vent metagenome TaxID=652676 RepID=A0A3B1CCH7_9ZZZZ
MKDHSIQLLLLTGREESNLLASSLADSDAIESIHVVSERSNWLEAMQNNRWDLILSDLHLSDFNCLDLRDYLVEHKLDIPVLLMAEMGSEDELLDCIEHGFEYCVLKRAQQFEKLPRLLDAMIVRLQKFRQQRTLRDNLLEVRERYQDIFDNTSDLIQCLASDGSFLYTNKTWREAMDYTEQEVASLSLLDVLHPDSRPCCQDRFERLKQGECLTAIDFKFISKSGETVYLQGDCGSIIRDGEAISTRGIFRNITDKVKTEEALQASEMRYQILYENAPDIYTTISPAGTVLSINHTGAHLLGYEIEELIGQPVLNIVHSDDREKVQDYIQKQFDTFSPDNGLEYRKVRKDGSVFWVHQCINQEPQACEPRLLVVCRDITDRRDLEEQLVYQAAHDSLTNLINRREFEKRLHHVLSSPEKGQHVLCYLDLDQFKVINDTSGHIAGDELLRQVAGLLIQQTRSRDTLARLGGDEFAVLMEDCPLEQAEHFANRIRESIASFRFQWGSRRFNIGVSIGVVPILEGDINLNDILSYADSACYTAKQRGRNQVHVRRKGDLTAAGRIGEICWASSITEALETDRFHLYAQPIHSCSKKTAGERFEILLRLKDGDKIVRPGAFMPAAERYNLSTQIDRWVLENLVTWFEQHPDFLPRLDICSINLSALSLCDKKFGQFAFDLLQASPLPQHKICFEITETAAISNLSRAVEFIEKLKQVGCHFALDDFGSGLSSFAYLKNLPVDMIKIDGTFVRNISKNNIERAMVKSICDIVSLMGKQTTAEYVEDEASLKVLRTLGVDFVQGYYLGQPKPLDYFAQAQVIPFSEAKINEVKN